MTPHYSDPLVTLYLGDCLDVMRELPDASVDSVVTDPPYGLEFMGKEWDRLQWGRDESLPRTGPNRNGMWNTVGGIQRPRYGTDPTLMQKWHEQWATEAFRVLKPGGYLLAFGGTRTYHRLASAIEDSGFEIRDTLMWIYASGFPKSLDVSKALDKVAGAEREQYVDPKWAERYPNGPKGGDPSPMVRQAARANDGPLLTSDPVSDLARKWEGWGTALKPAHEPIVMARKPLVGTVAQNVTRYGTGALNIDGSRIGAGEGGDRNGEPSAGRRYGDNGIGFQPTPGVRGGAVAGRWPSNVLLSDPELFGTSSRYFLIPKADRAERERGLAGAPKEVVNITEGHGMGPINTSKKSGDGIRVNNPRANVHPTVKPIDLMRHLVRLVTPPGGEVLDPFLGSGTTAIATSEEGFRCIGIERKAEYMEIAKGRIMATAAGMGL